MRADLHLHSTASDGTLSPVELTELAAREGLDMIALTDHDCVDGFAAAREAGEKRGVRVLSGVELSCGKGKEVHVLGYGVDVRNETLLAFCRGKGQRRIERVKKMCAQLADAGKPVEFDRVLALAQNTVGRPHVARAMVEAGHVRSVKEAFDRYLTPGKPGFVPKTGIFVAEAIQVIEAAGGVAVLAHPMELKLSDMALESLVDEWTAQGLAGIEVYHPSAANNQAAFLERFARRKGLLVTGGSDYHGPAMRSGCLGEGVGRWTAVKSDVQALLAAISAKRANGERSTTKGR